MDVKLSPLAKTSTNLRDPAALCSQCKWVSNYFSIWSQISDRCDTPQCHLKTPSYRLQYTHHDIVSES